MLDRPICQYTPKDPRLKGGISTSCQAVIANFTDRVVAEVVICPTSFCIPDTGR